MQECVDSLIQGGFKVKALISKCCAFLLGKGPGGLRGKVSVKRPKNESGKYAEGVILQRGARASMPV